MENEKKYVCPFCGRDDFKRKSDCSLHANRCDKNPNKKPKRKLSDETKRKISESSKGKVISEESKQKSSISHKGKKLSDETKQKISERSKQMWSDEEFKEKMSIINKKSWDEERKNKLSETMKLIWKTPGHKEQILQYWTDDKRKRHAEHISIMTKGHLTSDETKQKIKDAWTDDKRKQHAEHISALKKGHSVSDETKTKIKNTLELPETQQKIYNAKKKNKTFNTSKIETELKNYFDSNNIYYITQYKNNLYPFCCDFYFPDKDLYVEIQGSWTHGGKPYIETDPECIKQLEIWKSKNTKFYDNAINNWTIRDVKKRNIAKQNNLNWIEIFSCDLKTCLDIILNYL